MKKQTDGTHPLYIYVSGPYSPTAKQTQDGQAQKAIQDNIQDANRAALTLAGQGHIPFVPHTMMKGWQEDSPVGLGRERAMELCKQWVERCDALLFLGDSPGAEQERQVAVNLGLPIYRKLEDVPNATREMVAPISSQALDCYLEEYKQCADSYRHTYATIWQAGALLAAAAGVLASSGKVTIQAFAPLPIIVWYLALFFPMDKYGELRGLRLKKIEERLSSAISNLQMCHFMEYYDERASKKHWWSWRVKHAVLIVVALLFLMQIVLLCRTFSLEDLWGKGRAATTVSSSAPVPSPRRSPATTTQPTPFPSPTVPPPNP